MQTKPYTMDSIDATASFYSQIADAADTVTKLITDSREEYKELQISFENAIHSMTGGKHCVAFQYLYKLQLSIDVINLEVYTKVKTSLLLLHSDKLMTKTIGCEIENNDACPIDKINNSNNKEYNSNMKEAECTSTHVTENEPISKK